MDNETGDQSGGEKTGVNPLGQSVEPLAVAIRSGGTFDSLGLQLSMAISLKRIADALNEPNDHGETGTAAIAGAIVRGLRTIR